MLLHPRHRRLMRDFRLYMAALKKITDRKEESTRVHHTREERRGERMGHRRVGSTEAIKLNKHQLMFDM